MSKKTKIIIIITSVVVLLLVVVFLFLRNNNKSNDQSAVRALPEGQNVEGGYQQTMTVGDTITDDNSGVALFLVAEGPVAAATTNKEANKVLYYRRDNGHLYEAGIHGEENSEISTLTIPGITNAQWSKDKTSAVVSILKDDKIIYLTVTYSEAEPEGKRMDNGEYAVTLSPNGKQVAYAFPNEKGGAAIVLASMPWISDLQTIYQSIFSDINLYWITDSLLAIKTKTSAFAPSMAWTLTPEGIAKILFTPTTGLDLLFSKNGSRYLYSETQNGSLGFVLNVADITGENKHQLSVVTLPEKCVWANANDNILFCAVPRELPNASLPDTWWTGEVSFSDNIWRINLETGEKDLLWEQNDFDVIKPFSSPDDNYLFFINKKDSSLWSLKLK